MREVNDWRESAACRDQDPELFFPVSEVGPGSEQVQQAKAVCARCPVRQECLNYAIDAELAHGIFGGATPRERRWLTRRAERGSGQDAREQDAHEQDDTRAA